MARGDNGGEVMRDRCEYFLVNRKIVDLEVAKVTLNRGDSVYAPISWAQRFGDLLEPYGQDCPEIDEEKGAMHQEVNVPLSHEMIEMDDSVRETPKAKKIARKKKVTRASRKGPYTN